MAQFTPEIELVQPGPYVYVGTSTAIGSADVSLPAGVALGDLCLFIDYSVSTNNASFATPPAGWTNHIHSAGTYGFSVNWKILDAADISAGVVGNALGNASYQGERILVVFRGTGITPDVEFAGNYGDNFSLQQIDATDNPINSLIVCYSMARTNAGGGSLNNALASNPHFPFAVSGGNTNPVIFVYFDLSNDPVQVFNMQKQDAGFGNQLGGLVFSEVLP